MQQMQQANTPDPNIQRLLGLNNSIIDWHTNANNTVKDIYKHPTLGAKLPVFEMMKKNHDAGRIGRGVVGRTNMSSNQYADDMKLEDDFNRSTAAGGVLEMGLKDEFEGAQGNIQKLLGLDYGRKSGSFQNAAGLGGLENTAYNRVQASSPWNFLRGLVGGLAGSI